MKNILVVDDNRFILETLAGTLSRYLRNCNVLTASNGEKGAHLLRTMPIDLIISDLDIPLEDGYRFLEDARRSYPAIPLCVMTGDCTPQVKEQLMAMGISRSIEKPFPFEELARLISRELKLSRADLLHDAADPS